MSHFTVLVIGDNVEEQLAPFHEFECTGENDQYVQDIDVTEESVEHGTDEDNFNLNLALEYHGLNDKIVSDESEVDRNGKHKYGYAIVKNGQLIKAVNRTNPNAHWDWYQIGGRWSGFFKVKQGTLAALGEPSLIMVGQPGYEAPGKDRADYALKADIDWDGMRNEAAEEAGKRYDLYQSVIAGLPPIIAWDKIREKHSPDIDAARKEYHEQPGVKALRANKETIWLNLDDFSCTREQYVERARKNAVLTFAVIKDGQWYERGSMGWWGIVSDEKDRDEWANQFHALLEGLPDNTMLTVVDCHI